MSDEQMTINRISELECRVRKLEERIEELNKNITRVNSDSMMHRRFTI